MLKKYIVSRDGEFIQECNTETEVFALLHKLCPQSMEWALRNEGYKVDEVAVKKHSYTVQPLGLYTPYLYFEGCGSCGAKEKKLLVDLRQCLGRIQPLDIGKRAFLTEKGNWQVESQEQFEKRKKAILKSLNLT